MSKQEKSFVAGAAVLGIAGLLVKVIGAFYRIPLTNLIGTGGMGVYQVAYPIYAALLVVSTSGLPTAISKMVSEHAAMGDYVNARRIFIIARRILLVLGVVTTALMLFGNQLIARMLGDELAALPIMAIAPALFFVSVLSAYRGYFQGMQLMTPTALSQVIEQVGKLVLGLYMAYKFSARGVEYGAAGALLGVTLSEVAALALLMGIYSAGKDRLTNRVLHKKKYAPMAFKVVLVQLAALAIPITLGGAVMPLTQMIDTAMIHARLGGIGFSVETRRSLLGILTGQVNTLVNMPAVLSTALCMSLVPAVSASMVGGQMVGTRDQAETGLKLAILIGLPSAVGLYLLAEPILTMLYRHMTPDEIANAVKLMHIMSAAIFFLSLVQTMTGVLQGMGRVMYPVIGLCVGAVAKIVINYILLGIPAINISGAAIGTVCCYAVAALFDITVVARSTHMRLQPGVMLLRPLVSAAGMAVSVYFGYKLVHHLAGNTISTLFTVCVGVAVYGVLLILTGAIRPEDMNYIPGGGKLRRLLVKFRIWKIDAPAEEEAVEE